MSRREAIRLTGAAGNRLEGDLHPATGAARGLALLLHGGGQTRHAWRGTARRLADHGITAIAVDQRGHGDSAWVDEDAYGFEDFADDVGAMADELKARFGVAPAAIGASLGGLAALLAADRDGPVPLSALVLVDVTPRMDQAGVAKVLGFMGERVAEGFASIEEAAEAVASYLPERPRPTSLEGLRKNLRQGEDGRWRWHWDPRFLSKRSSDRTRELVRTDRLVDAARRLTIPALLVRGARSELVAEAHAREFLSLVPHAEYADVAGAGHMVAGDRNDAFADAVVAFLSKLDAGMALHPRA